jgi:ribosome modulation factor
MAHSVGQIPMWSKPVKNAAYWEGWQAVEIKHQCSYADADQRKSWARGFQDAVNQGARSKMWYDSRTLLVGLAMLAVGCFLIINSLWYNGGHLQLGIGSGVSSSSIIMAALRLITNTEVNFRDHDCDRH